MTTYLGPVIFPNPYAAVGITALAALNVAAAINESKGEKWVCRGRMTPVASTFPALETLIQEGQNPLVFDTLTLLQMRSRASGTLQH